MESHDNIGPSYHHFKKKIIQFLEACGAILHSLHSRPLWEPTHKGSKMFKPNDCGGYGSDLFQQSTVEQFQQCAWGLMGTTTRKMFAP